MVMPDLTTDVGRDACEKAAREALDRALARRTPGERAAFWKAVRIAYVLEPEDETGPGTEFARKRPG